MGYPFRQPTFIELVKGMDPCKLDDLHKGKVEALMVYDPKRKALVPSRFCSFHLAGFDLDEKSTAPLGPLRKASPSPSGRRPAEYVTANERLEVASSCIDVFSLRVVKAGPVFTYPVEVYGKVIARDEVDYKCVLLFDRERKDAQLINSEKDMLSLTGPYRPLNTLDLMYFEFDLKIKGRGEGDHDEEQFSKGVIPYYCKPDHKRIILQLPSFHSTVKLVLQRLSLPVAAIIEVNVVNEGQDDTIVHYEGKITAGTTRNYRQHVVLYDSSVPSVCSERKNGSLVLNRQLLAVNGYERDPAFEKDQLVLYVCFLDAGCEIEDEDEMCPEEEDEDDEDEEAGCEIEDEHEIPGEEDDDGDTDTDTDGDGDTDTDEDKDEHGDGEAEDPTNVVTLKYPQCEAVWEHGSPKLKVKVDWTAVSPSSRL
ncbi:unnamed protein product [Alopecurus aequalis]